MSPIVTLEQKKTDIIELKALRPVLEHSQLNPEKCKTAIKFTAPPPPPPGPNQSQGVLGYRHRRLKAACSKIPAFVAQLSTRYYRSQPL